jgi:phosphatidylglycerophosphate synthase
MDVAHFPNSVDLQLHSIIDNKIFVSIVSILCVAHYKECWWVVGLLVSVVPLLSLPRLLLASQKDYLLGISFASPRFLVPLVVLLLLLL